MLWWTLQNLVVAGLAAGLIALACRVAPIGPAGRHALWLVVLIKLVTPPLVVLDWPSAMPHPRDLATRLVAVRALVPAMPRATPVNAISTHAAGTSSLAPLTSTPRVAAAAKLPGPPTQVVSGALARLPVVWLAGALAFALIQSVRIARVARRVRAAGAADPALVDEIDGVARRMRIGSIPVRISSDIASPLIWCVLPWRPVLLWPAAPPAVTSDACHRGLIVHELAHVKRRDHWVGWLELAAGCLWWWSPLFWYVRSRVRENAELACDGWVIDAYPESRRAYAEALLAVCAATPRDALAPAIGVSTGNRRLLERRLAMIMRERPPLRLSRLGFTAVTLLAFTTLPLWAEKMASIDIDKAASRGVDTRSIPNPLPAALIDLSARPAPAALAAQTSVRAPRQAATDDVQRLLDRFAEQEAAVHREADEKIAQRRQELIRQLQSMQDAFTKAGDLDRAVAVRDRISRLQETRSKTAFYMFDGARSDADGPFVRFDVIGRTLAIADEASAFNLSGARHRVGETITLPLVGSTRGSVWGDGIYTDDSSLAAAAVHAGVVASGELGLVAVTILPGQDAYDESARHGVTSRAFGQWEGSFSIQRAPGTLSPESGPVRVPGDDATLLPMWLNALRGHDGVSLLVEVVGARVNSGNVWGTDVYTDDSSIAAAAVHAGILREGERGLVKVTVLPGRDRYVGSERNGVVSEEYGHWDGSFRVDRGR